MHKVFYIYNEDVIIVKANKAYDNKGGIIIKRKTIWTVSLVSIGIILGGIALNSSIDAVKKHEVSEPVEISEGKAILKELEKKNVAESEEIIDSVQASLQGPSTYKEENSGKINYIEKFSSSVILGDSRAESIKGYNILNKSSVVAYLGRNLITAQKNGDVDTAINLAPKNIFLTYGLNDIDIYDQASDFINEYKKVIKYIEQRLPNTEIYVNSIFAVSNKAIEDNKNLKKLPQFNEGIYQMCSELGVTYIDGSSIVDTNLYERDGIHFTPTFNKMWLELLIQKANL